MKRLFIPLLCSFFMTTHAFGQAPQTTCDRLAAHPSDTQKAAAGVEQEDFDIPAARAACKQALDAYPSEARFSYQYGRSFFYEDNYDDAMPHFERAAALGSAQGQLVLGLVVMGGFVGEPDVCRAGDLWLTAARQNHLYGKIYLLQNWLDGMFEDCGLDLSTAEAEAMVESAMALANTPQAQDQAKDDVAQLQDSWTQRAQN